MVCKMKAVLLPIKGNAAIKFDKILSSSKKSTKKHVSKKKREEIINHINKVVENENSKKLRLSGKIG